MPTGAMTLLESCKTMPVSQPRGIIQTYASTYHPLTAMGMISEPSGTHNWDLEYELPYTTGGTRLINGSWTATRSAISPYTSTCKIYGGEVKIDRALVKTNPGKVPQEKTSQIKAKARCFVIDMFTGTGGAQLRGIKDVLDNEKAFANQTENVGTASAGSVLLTDHLDKLLSLVSISNSTYIYCSQNMALRASKLNRGTNVSGDIGYQTRYSKEEWGFFSANYNGVPIVPLVDGKGTDLLPITDGDGSSTTLYAVTYGDDMFTGFQVSAPDVYNNTQADVYNYFDMEHLVGTAAKAIKSVARLRYVSDTV